MSRLIPVTLLAALPSALGWGYMGHEAVAYVATDFVTNSTRSYFQALLNDTSNDYLASVAAWADEWKKTDEGAFSYDYHFIDAQDEPPHSCNIDLERDCGDGCVVDALANYTNQLLDSDLSKADHQTAAKLVIHFAGDIGQPLHCEELSLGGNEVDVTFSGESTNLHTVWDSSIAEMLSGGSEVTDARSWATKLSKAIKSGEYSEQAGGWVSQLKVGDIDAVALEWATESNADVCTVVMPEGVEALQKGDLGGEYADTAQPTVALQIAKQGYRLARLLDAIVAAV